MFGLVPYQLASAYSLSVIPLFILMGAVASRANMATELFQASQRRVLRRARRARQRHDRRLRAVRRDLRLLDRDRRDLLQGGDPGDAPPRLRAGVRRRRGGLGRHARRADSALGADSRSTPSSPSSRCRSSTPRRSSRASCSPRSTSSRCSSSPGCGRHWVPKVAAMPLARAAARRARHVEARRAVLLRGVRHLSRLVLADRGGGGGGLRRHRDRLRAPARWAGAACVDALLETVYTTAAIFFIVVGAFIFSRFIVLTQFPNELAHWVQAAGLSPFWILLAVIALYVAARHVPRRGQHHPDHRAGHAAAGHRASATTASGSASSSP